VLRPNVGKRYSLLPVDRVDVTGFRASYADSPLRPTQIDIREGDQVFWYEKGVRYQALVDEILIDQDVLRVAFRDVKLAEPEW
jgi:hypothetical protein